MTDPEMASRVVLLTGKGSSDRHSRPQRQSETRGCGSKSSSGDDVQHLLTHPVQVSHHGFNPWQEEYMLSHCLAG